MRHDHEYRQIMGLPEDPADERAKMSGWQHEGWIRFNDPPTPILDPADQSEILSVAISYDKSRVFAPDPSGWEKCYSIIVQRHKDGSVKGILIMFDQDSIDVIPTKGCLPDGRSIY